MAPYFGDATTAAWWSVTTTASTNFQSTFRNFGETVKAVGKAFRSLGALDRSLRRALARPPSFHNSSLEPYRLDAFVSRPVVYLTRREHRLRPGTRRRARLAFA